MLIPPITAKPRSALAVLPSCFRVVAFFLLTFCGVAGATTNAFLQHDEVIDSLAEMEELYYDGRVIDYQQSIWAYLSENGEHLSPLSTWVILSRHFELCLWANSACGDHAAEATKGWAEWVSNAEELKFLVDLTQPEVTQMNRLVDAERGENYLAQGELFNHSDLIIDDGVYMVDQKTVANEHIYQAMFLQLSEKNDWDEIQQSYSRQYTHLFHALSIVLSESSYDIAQYRSSLRSLIRIIKGMRDLRIRNSALLIAHKIRPVLHEHFPANSYERVSFELLYADLVINSEQKIPDDLIPSLAKVLTAIPLIQWPNELQGQNISQMAQLFMTLACGKQRDAICFERNLANLTQNIGDQPIADRPNVYMLQSLSEYAEFIPGNLRSQIKNIFNASVQVLSTTREMDEELLGEVLDTGDLFGNRGLYKSTSNAADIRFNAATELRLSFREQVLSSHEKARLMNYLLLESSYSPDNLIILANELLVRGRFSNLAYSNVLSNLVATETGKDLVRDHLRLATQGYIFLAEAIDRYVKLPASEPTYMFTWNTGWDWLQAFSAYLEKLTILESELDGLNETLLSLLSPEHIMSKLLQDEALVYSVLRGDQMSATCISRKGVQHFSDRIDRASFNLHSRILSLSLNSSHPPSDDLDKSFPIASAHHIYEEMFDGVEECLTDISHLYWIPTDNLDRIPLGSLISSRSDSAELEAQEIGLGVLPWLSRRFSHSVLKSAAELSIPQLETPAERLLAIGDPAIPVDPKSGGSLASITRGLSAANLSLEELSLLPNTATELQQIASVFPGETELMLQETATEQNVRAALVSAPGVLTFATHGLVSGELENLNESALLLTPGPDSSNSFNDGLLTTSEISSLKIPSKFISLSACNTAIYEEGLFATQVGGLTSAFQLAGARTILGTLWPVETITAELINSSLYASESFKQGNFALALQEAQQQLVDGEYGIAYQHPRFWAAYNLYGPRRNFMDTQNTPPPVLRQEVAGRVSAIFKTNYRDALAVASLQEVKDDMLVVYGLLNPESLKIEDSMQADKEFELWDAESHGDQFLAVGRYFGKIDDQAEMWGDEWADYEGWTGYMELYDRSEDHGMYYEVPLLITGPHGDGHVSQSGTGTLVYTSFESNLLAAWRPRDNKMAFSNFPYFENQAAFQVHSEESKAYIAQTVLHPTLQNPSTKFMPNGMTASCGYLWTTHVYSVELDFESNDLSEVQLVSSVPNFHVSSIELNQGKLFLGGSEKPDCTIDMKSTVVEFNGSETTKIYESNKTGTIQNISAESGDLIFVEIYQSDSGISDQDLPAEFGQERATKSAIPISWEKFRQQRSRLLSYARGRDINTLATISSGGDSLVTAIEKTDEAIYVAGSSAGTPFIRKIPTTAEASLQH